MRKWLEFELALLVAAMPWAAYPADRPASDLLSAEAIGRVVRSFEEQLARNEIPGGALVIVEQGAVTHARGFGVENLESRRPVDPARTAFYLASVTKPFTATAVMQQVEQGRLALRRDVNDTLTHFKVPAAFEAPITLHHLLTHTAGFDDRLIGYSARSVSEALLLGTYLARDLPARVMAPGLVTAYSNHGYGLAGHLVEIASGERFEDYLETHILKPLGMARSTAHTPPPPDTIAADLATGYFYNSRTGAMEPAPLGARNVPPAGTVIATPLDVARFMIAHLSGGAYQGERILRPETARSMQARQFSNHPDLPGVAYGFYERFRGPHRVLEHAGGYPGWATLMALVPEREAAIFLATNQNTSAPHYAALEALLSELFGAAPATASVVAASGDPARWRPFAGSYQSTRYSRETVEKLAILDTQITVSVEAPGRLVLAKRQGAPTRWVEIGPRLFRREDGAETIAFRGNAEGGITHLFGTLSGSSGLAFPLAFERVAWHDRASVQVPYMIVTAAIMASTFTLAPLAGLGLWGWRRLRGGVKSARPAPRGPWIAAACAGLLSVAFFAGLDGLLGNSAYRMRLAYGMTSEMVALLWLPIALAVLTPGLAWLAIAAWRRGWWNATARLYYTVVAAAGASLIGFLANWHLLGFWY